MITRAVAAGTRIHMREAAQHAELLLVRLEGLQRRGQIKASARLGRRPVLHVHAIWQVDEAHPLRCASERCTRGSHRLKERQGDAGSDSL